MKDWKRNARVQFITHETPQCSTLGGAQMALEGGCRWIQLRMKGADRATMEATARQLRRMCTDYSATFIIDDEVELALRTGADGVHLGLNDMPIRQARELLGEDFIIGGTANSFFDVQRHYIHGADYIGCGPYRYTTTKANLSPILGLEGYERMMHKVRNAGIPLPLVAIGGIGFEDIPALMQTGISGIALSGSILRAADPVGEMRRVVRCVEGEEEI